VSIYLRTDLLSHTHIDRLVSCHTDIAFKEGLEKKLRIAKVVEIDELRIGCYRYRIE